MHMTLPAITRLKNLIYYIHMEKMVNNRLGIIVTLLIYCWCILSQSFILAVFMGKEKKVCSDVYEVV